MKIVSFTTNGLMDFKEGSTKYLKQGLRILCLLAFASSAFAQTHEVLMKNCGVGGPMVYEPDYLEIQPGGTVKLIHKHKSHNVASIVELSPADYPGFMGKIDEEIEVTYDNAGFHDIKCTPHHAQGMVMLIKAGDVSLPENYQAFKAPDIADKRFQEVYARINKR